MAVFFHIIEISKKWHFFDTFGQAVSIILMGLTAINSSGQFQAKKLRKKVHFYLHLNAYSLRVVDQSSLDFISNL